MICDWVLWRRFVLSRCESSLTFPQEGLEICRGRAGRCRQDLTRRRWSDLRWCLVCDVCGLA